MNKYKFIVYSGLTTAFAPIPLLIIPLIFSLPYLFPAKIFELILRSLSLGEFLNSTLVVLLTLIFWMILGMIEGYFFSKFLLKKYGRVEFGWQKLLLVLCGQFIIGYLLMFLVGIIYL